MGAAQHQASPSSSSSSSSSSTSGVSDSSGSSVIAVTECSCCLQDACKSKEQIRIGAAAAAAASTFCGRRAMVNKLWIRELFYKWFQSKREPPSARCFSESRYQAKLGLWYLLYRWLVFALWLLVIVCSVFEIGSVKPLNVPEKWPIYLTNWDLSLGLLQALLGLLLVSRRWRLERARPDLSARDRLGYGKLEKAYWFLNVVTTSLALGVTSTYWTLVHDPRYHQLDPLNLMIHVGNSLLMLLDFGIGRVPFELRCFWWCPLLVGFYILFSLVYYAAGGTDKHGEHRIYNILDWQKPQRTLIVCAAGLTFLVVTHCLLCLLAMLRDKQFERRRANKYSVEERQRQDKKAELNVQQTV